MREIPDSEVKTRRPKLPGEAQRGETPVITRHRRAAARSVPDINRQQKKIDDAMSVIRRLRLRSGRIDVADLLSARDEGRRA